MCPPVAQHCGHRARLCLEFAGAAGAQDLGDVVSGAVLYNHVGESKQARRPAPALGCAGAGRQPAGAGRRCARPAGRAPGGAPAQRTAGREGIRLLWALHADEGALHAAVLDQWAAPGAWEGRLAYPACHAAGLNTQALEPGGTASAARAGGLRADAHRAAGAALRRQAARPAGAPRQACRAAGERSFTARRTLRALAGPGCHAAAAGRHKQSHKSHRSCAHYG
jgi:hypothetical protein